MQQLSKIISISYLLMLSAALLTPLDSIFVTQIIEEENQPSTNSSFAIHLALFFLLYFLFYFSFVNKKKILIFCILYAVIIEILQLFTSRGFQILDVLFNIIGVIISLLIIRYFFKK